jgi:hypothetical protein
LAIPDARSNTVLAARFEKRSRARPGVALFAILFDTMAMSSRDSCTGIKARFKMKAARVAMKTFCLCVIFLLLCGAGGVPLLIVALAGNHFV